MRRRKEQYTHGRLRKYVHMKKRNMNMGEAFVGIKRRGNQLGKFSVVSISVGVEKRRGGRVKREDGGRGGKDWTTYLLKQNIVYAGISIRAAYLQPARVAVITDSGRTSD
jgi:hypothetical protein